MRLAPLAVLFVACPLAAQDAPPDTVWLPVQAGWAVGDRRRVDIEKVDAHREGESTRVDSTFTAYDVLVVEATPEGEHLVRWRPVAYVPTEDEPSDAPAMDDALLARLEREGLLLRLDGLGRLVRLENAETVRALMTALVDSLAAELPDLAERGGAFLDAMRSDTFIENLLLEPMALYYDLHGQEYALGVKAPFETALPWAFGDAIPASGTFQATDYDPVEGTFAVRVQHAVEPDVFRAAVEEMMGMAGAPEEQLAAAFEGVRLEFRNDLRYVVEEATGWVSELEHRKTISFSGGRRTITHAIRTTRGADGHGEVFRYADLPSGRVVLGEPFVAPSGVGRREGPAAHRLPGGFEGVTAVTVYTSADGRAAFMRFDYEPAFDVASAVASYEALYGPSAKRRAEGGHTWTWEDGWTRLELISPVDRSPAYSVLRDLMIAPPIR